MNPFLPLDGKSILIPRGGTQGKKLCDKISQLGGTPYMVPLIDFRKNHDPNAREYLKRIDQYNWIIFTSQTGVKFFFQQLAHHNLALSPSTKIAAVGEKTKMAIEKFQLEVSFVPDFFSADDFANEFTNVGNQSKRVLIPKGNLARDVIAKSLVSLHWIVDEWIIYKTIFPRESKEKLIYLLENVKLDYGLFTSPSTFHHFMEVANDPVREQKAKTMRIISIGPVTNRAVESYGWKVSASPEKYTMEDMMESLCKFNINGRNTI
ncbi:uroporphyrinogen-III synthase [Bacillus sp. FJAT-49736]|uniref:uroporphyrinogen-III synthase n=1 Tax=Bacillus sp. FJAT-49736 TaxID=2833582 RepID=UPI001BC92026|nr:uroporphyrinogen-III synthase [Bacillus sp. FJAT-49736]MBS4173726.1 uroporphyrinogen-III synthase [Bacillus sp. FJAT-49736]